MKILIYTNIVPFELDEGGKVAQFVFLRDLNTRHEVVLVSSGNKEKLEQLDKLKIKLNGLKTILIKDSDSNERIVLFEKIVGFINWELTKWLNRKKDKNRILNTPFFLNPFQRRSRSFVKQWMEILEFQKPEIIQIDFIDNADLAILIPKEIKKAIVVHDLRFASIAQTLKNDSYPIEYINYARDFSKTSEVAYLNNFDRILLFSEGDKKQLSNNIDLKKLFVTPFAVDDDKFHSFRKNYSIKKLVYIGPDYHEPNLDAMLWYSESLSKLIYNKFGLELVVIGNWSNENKLRFKKYAHIDFIGYVQDLNEAIQDSVLIVPLRIGSGIRTKIIEAFALGVPVISTSIGAEGINVSHGTEIYIADEISDFVEGLQILLNDSLKLSNMRLMAREFVDKNFSSEKCFNKRIEIYDNLIKSSL